MLCELSSFFDRRNERNECCYCSSPFSPAFQETAALLERFYIPSGYSYQCTRSIYPALSFPFLPLFLERAGYSSISKRCFIPSGYSYVYQVFIPCDILPFLSLLERGCSSISKVMLYALRLFVRVPGLDTLRCPSLPFRNDSI